MKSLPLSIGSIHFIGIGGIGMSGIAEIMHNLGYSVQGSDISDNANVKRLRKLGIKITIGHSPSALTNVQVVVTSSAIEKDNIEALTARQNFIPVVRRSEMLAELMRLKWSIAIAGTHGKTTTTSIVAALLDAAAIDPTVINGGIINAYGTNARLGAGDWMVVEADESDGGFVKLPATVAVITNIDPEHMEFYRDFEAVRNAYYAFLENLPFYGFAALCLDHPEVQALVGRISDRRIITYGLSPQAEVRAFDIKNDALGSSFNIRLTDRHTGTSETLTDVRLPMHGKHNILNSLAAVAVGREMQISNTVIRSALGDFKGVKRRFTKTGVVDGISIIDDYGHHPVEIAAVLKAARESSNGQVIAVVQPHRYTRLRDLFEEFCTCFNDAHILIVAPVHSAGEQPIEGFDRDSLIEGVRIHGHRQVIPLPASDALATLISELANPGDIVVCLGAGSITNWANDLPSALREFRQSSDSTNDKNSTGSAS